MITNNLQSDLSKSPITVFASHSLASLVDPLYLQLQNRRTNFFDRSLIVIPHHSMKEWLQLELCKRSNQKAILGLQFVSWKQVVKKILKKGLSIPTRYELAAALWSMLSKKSSMAFVEELTTAFEEYCLYGLPHPCSEEASRQQGIFKEIFRLHGWSTYTEAAEERPLAEMENLHLFGIDDLPSAICKLFLNVPVLHIYRFSPCAMFWEDLCSSSERKRWIKKWEKKQVSHRSIESLNAMLRDAQPLLANWGMIGRAMLAKFASYELDLREDYECEESNLLNLLKRDLLLLHDKTSPELISADDSSILCVKTGSSLFREMQWLREEILRIVSEGASFSDIRIYAPDLSVYRPFVEFYFTDARAPIPFRMEQKDLSQQSDFYQAIVHLFRCVEGRWEASDLVALFEMSALRRKAQWTQREMQRFQQWIEMGNIRWGLDTQHRREVSEIDHAALSEAGSWDLGWIALIDRWIFFHPEQTEDCCWSEVELFEQIYLAFQQMRNTLLSWKQEKTLSTWANEISAFVESMLSVEETSEVDLLGKASFERFLDLLRKLARTFPTETFAFSWIETLLTPLSKEEKGSLLNAVRLLELQPGSILPARVIFIIGMDEESFPRNILRSSLCMPCQESPRTTEFDRYIFLQALFAAQKQIIFSYGHISKEDGKPMSASLLIQELFGYLDSAFSLGGNRPSHVLMREAPSLFRSYRFTQTSFLTALDKIPQCAEWPDVLSIQKLSRFFKNPLHAYLKDVLGVKLRERPESSWKEFECSPLVRHRELLFFLERGAFSEAKLSLGLFGQVAEQELMQMASRFRRSLQSWDLDVSQITEQYPSLQLSVGQKAIHLSGDGALTVPGGVLHLGSDEIGSFLRKWPELLSGLVATNTSRIYCLKTGKVREVVDPLSALQSIVELYVRCQKDPLFLHPEWADAVLRKHRDPELDQIKDPVMQWVVERSPLYEISQERAIWSKSLQQAFSSLIALFPTRGQYADS